ncbi:HNH endonuclease family protein [Gordonia polyisoprenivorans]|uniref:HNH endonuclease family protein n=1 Tax=Gordonia polyisoprenivorans TaxID=84595 RepID=UPI003CC82088
MATAVGVAVTVHLDRPSPDEAVHADARRALHSLAAMTVVAHRPDRDDYQRSAFGAAWTDAVSVTGGHNGCDTRNDILARDLSDVTVGPIRSCPRAVLTGEFRSPYTGATVVFRRDRSALSVQIDHIVPLSLSWDLGAWSWPAQRRVEFANDPANLVAVDAASNQAKSDGEPAVWMPPLRAFHCRYAIAFVAVADTYRLAVDAASRRVLTEVLDSC